MLIGDISEREHIPHKFLELILLELKNLGYLVSKKGRGGGYMLAHSPQNIFVGDVIRCMEGPLAQLPCASQTAYKPCEECSDPESCGLRMVMKEVRDSMTEILDHTSLSDILSKAEQAMANKAKDFTYHI